MKAIPGHPRGLALFVNNRGAEINPSRGRLFEGRLALTEERINVFRRGMKIIRLTLDITGQAACGLVRVDGLVRHPRRLIENSR